MNLKYFEHIVKYLPVVVAGAILGALARVAALAKGVDDYTANIIFLSVTALSVIAYALIVLFLDGIIKNIKILPRKHNFTNLDEKLLTAENIEKIGKEQQEDNEEKAKDNFVAQLPETTDVDLIRKTLKTHKNHSQAIIT